jgi:hypothetical protein
MTIRRQNQSGLRSFFGGNSFLLVCWRFQQHWCLAYSQSKLRLPNLLWPKNAAMAN